MSLLIRLKTMIGQSKLYLAACLAGIALAWPAFAAPLDMQAVNDAQWSASSDQRPAPRKGKKDASRGADARTTPMLVKAQILLDRARFSPGEIDGKGGENFKKALTGFASDRGFAATGELTEELWQALNAVSSEPALIEYTISDDDVRGPFAKAIPARMEAMKDLPSLAYTSAREKIAEKFHMSQDLLQALNPGQKFETAGGTIIVANVAAAELPEKAARIEVDKSAKVLKVFGRDQKLLAFYPATVGSGEKPAPSGRLKVTNVSKNPTYRYNPKYAFKSVRTSEPFTIKAGPNNPVGVVWIGLSSEGYGIHGTPDPGKVSKTESHGCVRLTNWDALRLAAAVSKGTPVDFSGDEQAARNARAQAKGSGKRR
jgi:lipoprotein-anchoring transpeptidase ErfK/SrfK